MTEEIPVDGYIRDISKFDKRKPKAPKTFNIVPKGSETCYRVEENMFFPIMEGDYIRVFLQQKDDFYFRMTSRRIVTVGDGYEQVKETALKSAWGTGVTKHNVDSFLSSVGEIASNLNYNSVSRYLDYLAERQYYFDKHSEDHVKPNLPASKIKEEKVEIFLRRWIKNRIFRQLYLIGFNNGIIDKMAENHKLLDIYEISITNPYKIVHIPIELCDHISMTILGEINPINRFGGQVLRELYNNMTNFSWTYTPAYFLDKKFSYYKEFEEHLRKEFNIVFDENRVYMSEAYLVETKVAEIITDYLEKGQIEEVDMEFEDQTTEEQQQAIKGVLSHAISVIDAPPGTGKSTSLAEICKYLEEVNEPYFLTSFTGKAVQRIIQIPELRKVIGKYRPSTELNTDHILTIDRMIIKLAEMFELKGKNFLKNVTWVIDEASMVTSELFYRGYESFLGNLKRIIFIGDQNQLPPISWGQLFIPLINSKVEVYTFTKCFRMSNKKEGEIHPVLKNSKLLLEHVHDKDYPKLDKCPEFKFIKGGIEKIREYVDILYESGRVELTDFKIICPFKKDLLDINYMVSEIYLPYTDREEDSWKNIWTQGSLVMMTQNYYTEKLKLMNGEEGIIEEFGKHIIKTDTEIIEVPCAKVSFPGKGIVNFMMTNDHEEIKGLLLTKQLAHSSAITVHKSQGSEYKYVFIYYPKKKISDRSKSHFLNYKLNNTAITRCKESCTIIGDADTFWKASKKMPVIPYDYLHKRIPSKEVTQEFDVDYEPDYDYEEIDYEELFAQE